MRKTEISENPAFTFRTFLLRLGLIGPEYKNVEHCGSFPATGPGAPNACRAQRQGPTAPTMNLNQMAFRCPDAQVVDELEGYRLAFCMNGGGHGVATILPEPDSFVDGVLWRISERDEHCGRPGWPEAGSHGLYHEQPLQGRPPLPSKSIWRASSMAAGRMGLKALLFWKQSGSLSGIRTTR